MKLVILQFLVFLHRFLAVVCQKSGEPFFTNTWNWQIEENARIGSRPKLATLRNSIALLTAYDADGDRLEFRSEENLDSSYFTVDSNTGVVKLRKPFDREVVNSSTARFSVSDGENKVFGVAHIDVTDVNDNYPTFERSRYNVTIREDTPVDSEVFKIIATDPDLGAGGEINYSIEQAGASLSPFRIDSRTGSLFLKELIDFESAASYRFVATARDADPFNS